MNSKTGAIFPAIQYEDAPTAIEWFCNTLGFSKLLVVPAGENKIAHAQLALGNELIMISSPSDSEYGKHMTTPSKIDNKNTQSLLLFVQDDEIEIHYQNAVNSGANILVSLRSEEYGGRYYSLKDPEGHLWSVGSYDPFASPNKS